MKRNKKENGKHFSQNKVQERCGRNVIVDNMRLAVCSQANQSEIQKSYRIYSFPKNIETTKLVF